MSFTPCPTCQAPYEWSWEEAFDKFGFADGDAIIMTEPVANALRAQGYTVTTGAWGVHNVTISSIRTKNGRELIPPHVRDGYDDPRDYLPKRIIKLLDASFPPGKEVPLCA